LGRPFEHLENIKIGVDFPVILVSDSVQEWMKKTMDIGIRMFVPKPILKRKISEIIRNVLGMKKH
jgi:DNA-binding NarL/FixJ family response regulator